MAINSILWLEMQYCWLKQLEIKKENRSILHQRQRNNNYIMKNQWRNHVYLEEIYSERERLSEAAVIRDSSLFTEVSH